MIIQSSTYFSFESSAWTMYMYFQYIRLPVCQLPVYTGSEMYTNNKVTDQTAYLHHVYSLLKYCNLIIILATSTFS